MGALGLHRSHALVNAAGFWLCARCGAWSCTSGAKTSPKRLVAPCAMRATRAGRDVLRRLAKGRPPKRGQQWADRMPVDALLSRRLAEALRGRPDGQHAQHAAQVPAARPATMSCTRH